MSPIFFQHPSSLIFIHALPLAYFTVIQIKKLIGCQWFGQQETFLKNVSICHIKCLQQE